MTHTPNTLPPLPSSLIQAISAYGDARADDGESGARLGDAIEAIRQWGAALAQSAQAPAPDGFRLIAVSGFDALVTALDRADRKGYMPDAIADEWEAFDYREAPAQPAPSVEAVQLNNRIVQRLIWLERGETIDVKAFAVDVRAALEALARGAR